MRTQVFAHQGYIGITSSPHADGLLNSPLDKNQIGFVVDSEYVDIQPEAVELLKQVKKSGDDIGDIDVFKDDNERVIFSWLGGPMRLIDLKTATGSNIYDASLLSPSEGIETPQEFIDFIESIECVR